MQKRTMSPITATSRLKNDYLQLMKDPVPYVVAEPLPSNILEWHYVVTGPPDSPYAGGYYHGKLIFPQDFPFKPPSFFMNTPSGRFKVNYKLCLSPSTCLSPLIKSVPTYYGCPHILCLSRAIISVPTIIFC